MPVSSSTEHWIKPDALTINLNHFGDPDYLQVSVLAGAVVMAFKQDVIGYNAAHNYRTWPLEAANTYLETTSAYNVYARLTRSEVNARALVVYDTVLRDIEGREITYKVDEETGEEVEVLGEANPDYFFVFLGQISASVNEKGGDLLREWMSEFRFGNLNTNQYQNEEAGGEWSKMFRLNKITDYIDVLKTISSAVFKKLFIKEKGLEDVATSADKENEEAINDTTIATTAWVSEKFSGISDDKYLRKDQPDRTPYDLAVGGVLSTETSILFQNKQISGFIRKYDDPRPEVVTDTDFYSALMTDERIEEEFRNLDDRYLRKDPSEIPDTAHRYINFEEGITVYKLATMMNLQVNELATIARAIVDILGSAKFVDGFFGEGYQIWRSIATEDWCLTIDRLTVRKVMTVYELLIQKIRSVGGMIVVSAGNGKVKEVVADGLEYKFTFEDTNTFVENDLMRCQVWTGTGIKSYWVEVTRVEGENVFARIADFGDTMPEAGDEVVLMGNTRNKLRQNLLLLSATEDGQPRFDCLSGIHTKNFEGCLRTRVGCLDGISDDQFPPGLQPQGYGLYADNCYLRGVFVLSTGVDVLTQFSIMEGQIRANMSSVQQQINAEDNYLSNASFASDLEKWEYANDVRIFDTAGGLLHFNGEFYSDKRQFAGIVVEEGKNVLRLKNNYIKQLNTDFFEHPEFDKVEQKTTDEEGKEVGTGVMLYHPTMFFISFKYFVAKRGTLSIRFEGEETKEDFEAYEPINVTKVLDENAGFETMEIAGKWNGTGDFYLSFDGDIFIYDLALANNKLADMEERWNMKFELTEKQLTLNFEHIIQQGEDLEEYRSEYIRTAEEMRSEYTKIVKDKEEDITAAYTGLITQTAETLESDYTAKFGDYYGIVTEEYNSKITQTAKDITATLTARIDNTDKDLADTEAALIKDYEAKISASAQSLSSDYNAKITDLRTGDIATMKSSITQNANQIATKVSQTQYDALSGRVTKAESSITQQADKIALMVTKGELSSEIDVINDLTDSIVKDVEANALAVQNAQRKADDAYGYASTNYSLIQEQAGRITAVAGKIQTDASGKITNISTSGLVLDSEFSSLFSTEVSNQGIAKTAQLSVYVLETKLGELVSKIDISADQLDIDAVSTYLMKGSSVKTAIDEKADTLDLLLTERELNDSISALTKNIDALQTEVDEKASKENLTEKVNELNEILSGKADTDLSNALVKNAVLGDATLIVGGYINTGLIKASELVISGKKVDGLGALAFLDSVSVTDVRGIGSLATYDKVVEAMEGETVAIGGYIQTKLINSKSLVVNQLEATDDKHVFYLDEDGFRIDTVEGKNIVHFYGNDDYGSMLQMWSKTDTGWAYLSPDGLTVSKGINDKSFSVSLENGTVNLNGGVVIKGLGIYTNGNGLFTEGFQVSSATTFNIGDYSPLAYKGRIMFVYYTNECTVSGLYVGSVKCKYGTIFISNGSYWYHIGSKY